MLLLLFLIAGLLIGQLRGGGLSGLVRMGMRAPWLVVLPFLVEFSFRFLNASLLNQIPYGLYILQSLRFIPLLLFVILNLRNWRIVVMGVGVLLNFSVIVLNQGRMPISELALLEPQLSAQVLRVQQGLVPEYVLMIAPASLPLWFFGDIIIMPLPILGFASVGDVVLGLGLLLTVQHGMARFSHGKHVRGSLSPKSESEKRDRSLQEEEPFEEPYTQQEDTLDLDDTVSSLTEAVTEEQTAAERVLDPVILEEPQRLTIEEHPRAVQTHEVMLDKESRPAPSLVFEEEPQLPPAVSVVAEEYETPELSTADKGDEQPAKAEPVPLKEEESPYQLSARLTEIASMIPRWANVADVGCDHGKLAVHLAQRGTPLVIATDISTKSLAKAKALVREQNLQGQIKTRVSDGLKKIKPGEVDCIVISGLGGPTICEILDNSPGVIQTINRLVLQPQNAVGAVRSWILNNGFRVDRETIVQEDGRLYQVLSAVPGIDGTRIETLFDQEIGALLIRDKHPLLPQLLQQRIATIDTILTELGSTQTPKAQSRRIELQVLRSRCMEVLQWIAR